jgi:hypothetical protein
VSEEIHEKNQSVSPRSGAPTPRGGARAGAGRKPDPFKKLFDEAIRAGVTQEGMNQIVRSLVMEASTGNVQAANALLDRMLGKVPQAVQHQGDTGGPLRVVVEYETK